MKQRLYSQLAEIEDIHWAFVHRRNLVEGLLSKLNINKFSKGLDIGCGTGGNLKFLKKYCCSVTGLDISEVALDFARIKGKDCNLVRGDANYLANIFSPKSFGLISIFNVLYHEWIKDDLSVLMQCNKVLIPGGILVVTESAFNFLNRNHDCQAMGKRRYKLSLFRKMLSDSGFTVLSATYYNALSFVPALILAFLNIIIPNQENSVSENDYVKELQIPMNNINNLVSFLMNIERKLIKILPKLPMGVTLLCIARKNNS